MAPAGNNLWFVRKCAHDAVDLIIDHFEALASGPIVKTASEQDVALLEDITTPTADPSNVLSVVQQALRVFSFRISMDHPRFFGFIPSPLSHWSWIGDMLASAFNVHAGSWLQSSGPTLIERKLIAMLASAVGFPATAGGVFVSGGSMANLTAIICARDRLLDVSERSVAVVYTSEQTHGSIAKACKLAGFLDSQIRRLPVDGQFRMRVDALDSAIIQDRENGLRPLAVFASAGTTNTGAIDPLAEIHGVTSREGLWLHVDGAYGASVALSKTHRGLLRGVELADSVSWDAHKWLFQSYGCGILLVRQGQHLLDTYANSAEYLRDAQGSSTQSPNMWDYGIELTRPARAMKLWFTMQVLGLDAMGEMIDKGFPLAEAAERAVRLLDGWEVTSPASMAIVTFRYAPQSLDKQQQDELNVKIAQEAIATDTAGILTTKINGKVVLRICAINPSLQTAEMESIVLALDGIAKKLSE